MAEMFRKRRVPDSLLGNIRANTQNNTDNITTIPINNCTSTSYISSLDCSSSNDISHEEIKFPNTNLNLTNTSKNLAEKNKTSNPPNFPDTIEDCQDDTTTEFLRDVKLIQKSRMPKRGINIQAIYSDTEKQNIDEDEEQDISYSYGLLDRQFTSKGDPCLNEIDIHLEEYLNKHLPKGVINNDNSSKNDPDINSETTKSSKPTDRAAELYQIPKHLQVRDTLAEHADRMNWVTGLVEVPLPLETKLKNIEATEKARRKLLKIGSMNQNSENNQNLDSVLHKAFGNRFQNFDTIQKTTIPTDRLALDRFRKRQRR